MPLAPAHAVVDVNKSYLPATLYPNQVSTLTIELQNTQVVPSAGVSLIDVFPADTFVAATPNVTNTCGGVATPSNGASQGQISLTGAGIPAGDGTNPGRCSISVDVYGSTAGTYVNTIAAGDVTATTGGVPETNGQAAQATLTLIIDPVSVDIGQADGTLFTRGGASFPFTMTLTNPNPVPLTDLAFLWNFASQSGGASTAFVNGTGGGTCGGTVTATDEGGATTTRSAQTNLSVSGATVPANGSCTVTIDIAPRAVPEIWTNSGGDVTFATGTVTTTEGASNTVSPTRRFWASTGMTFFKTFDGLERTSVNAASGPASSVLKLFFTNNNAIPMPLDFTDVMPTTPGQMSVVSLGANTCGGTPGTNGGTELTITGGTVPASISGSGFSESCQIEATVEVTADGEYVNDVPNGTQNGYSYAGDIAYLSKSSGILAIDKNFTAFNMRAGDENFITYTFSNLSDATTGLDITGLRIRDDFEGFSTGGFNYGNQFIVSAADNFTTTCPSMTVEAAPGNEFFQASGITVPRGQSCDVSVQIMAMGNVRLGTRNEPLAAKTAPTDPTNEGVLYDTSAASDIVFGGTIATSVRPVNRVDGSMEFLPDTVAPGGRSRIRYTVNFESMRGGPALEDIFLRDTLESGATVAGPLDWSSTCGGTMNATPGTNLLEFSGGAVAGPILDGAATGAVSRICVIEVAVNAPATIGSYPHTIPRDVETEPFADWDVTAKIVGAPAPYNQLVSLFSDFYFKDTLNVAPLSMPVNKEFLTTVINGGAPSRVRITFSNSGAGSPDLSGLSLTDDFSDTSMFLYSDPDPVFADASGGTTGACRGGSITAVPGAQSVTLSGGEIDAAALCYLEFNVTADVGGNHINAIAPGDVSTNENVTNPAGVSATLTVDRELNIGKGFEPAIIGVGDTSTLRLDIINSNLAPVDYTGVAGVSMVDVMPTGLTVNSIDSNSCGGTTSIGSSGGNDTVQLSGGSFPAESVCTITATVTAAAVGNYVNNIAINTIITNEGGSNVDAASATLRVINPPTIAKAFAPAQIAEGNASTITFTLTNNADVGLSGASFTDPLSNMEITSPLEVAGTCGGIEYTAAPGGNSFTLDSATLPANGSCTVTVDVTSTTIGSHDNTTSGVSTDATFAGAPSNTATLTVLGPPVMTKSFSPAVVAPGALSTVTLTLSNPNATDIDLHPFSAAVRDVFPVGMTVAATPNASTTCATGAFTGSGGTGSIVPGGDGFGLRDGIIPAGGSCTISVDVEAPVFPGSYTNTTTTVRSVAAGIGASASAVLSVSNADFDFSDAPATGNSYGVAFHEIVAGLRLGVGLTAETGAFTDADNASDDGITVPSLTPGDTANVIIPTGDIIATSSGTVNLYGWIDFDNDGQFGASEFASTTVTNGLADGPLTFSSYGTTGSAGITYARFRLTSDTLSPNAAATAASDGEVEDYAISIGTGGTQISGRIFLDTGAGGGTAHDAALNGSESGGAYAAVTLTEAGSGTPVATATVNAGGSWSATLPDGYTGTLDVTATAEVGFLTLSEATSGLPALVNASATDGTYRFTPASGTSYTGLDFGLVPEPILTQNQSASLGAGQIIGLAHRYEATSAGLVTFDLTEIVSNPEAAFSTTLFSDTNCDGQPDSVLSAPVAVTAEQAICLVVRTQLSGGASPTASLSYGITALTQFSGTAVTALARNDDAINGDVGTSLSLRKLVRNISAGTPETTSNTGGPGDMLEYRLIISNPGSAPLTNVRVRDATPAWTVLSGTIPAPVTVSPGLTCSVIIPSAGGVAGYQGQLEWQCPGTLPPGAEEVVTFNVTIQ